MHKVHRLKLETKFFNDDKNRNFEVRKNDRDYEVGDTLILEEYDPDRNVYLRGWIPKEITCIFDDPRFVKEGYVILGTKEIKF